MPIEPTNWFTPYKDITAAVIATFGILALLFQISQTSRQERDRIRRRRIAATATLPLTLSALSGYAQGMMRSLAPLETWTSGRRNGDAPVFEGPAVPSEAIAAVEQMIEVAPDEQFARQLASVVSDIQVLSSRTNGLRMGDIQELHAQSTMVDVNIILAAEIYARIEISFDYARSFSNAPEPAVARVRSALNLAGLRNHHYPRLHQRLDRQEARVVPTLPWYLRS